MALREFEKRCAEVRDTILSFSHPVIVGHYDADGLAATALVAKALQLHGRNFSIITLKRLGEAEAERLRAFDELVFVDLGGSATQMLNERLAGKRIAIIDHHQTAESALPQANPHLFGFDGGTELSSSSTAYCVFRQPALVELALVGAVGDMQAPMRGLNREILRDGIAHGIVQCSFDLQLFGRVSRPLAWLLSYCSEPLLPGLTGDERACARFLERLGIALKRDDEWRRYYELAFAERQRLVSALAMLLCDSDASGSNAKSLVGEVYTFPQQPLGTELSDASEFATLLNACGRHGKHEIGISACLGDESAYKQAHALLQEHRRQLRRGIAFASSTVSDFGKFHFLDARGAVADGIVGIVAGMLYGTIGRGKPVIAAALDEEGNVKISARATKQLVDAGLNLGALLADACSGIGIGGGHRIAAGATIRSSSINEFLQKVGALLSAKEI